LFDSSFVREEYRSEVNIRLKEHANFFKHANKQEVEITFKPALSEWFILLGIMGLSLARLNQASKKRRLDGGSAYTAPKLLQNMAASCSPTRFPSKISTPSGNLEGKSSSMPLRTPTLC
jgi:hypothetical protein